MTRPFVLLLALLACSPARAASAGTAETITVPVRGRSVPLTIYIPPAGAPQRGTVIMGSGDVGWVGLSVTAAEFLLSQGYIVAGVNVRRYLSDFTSGSDHVTVDQIGQDYRAFAQDPGNRASCCAIQWCCPAYRKARRSPWPAGAASANHDWVETAR